MRPAAGAPSVSDAQPTIPIRALADSAAESGAAQAAARLFVLTTDLQGMDFDLDRASLVIGRTDENDIVLPHRSISRHHAKIVRDGDHHTIVDLQSANGVRVNGEDYERIELNPGDIIELGHVKLRFVGALEDYVFKAGVGVRGPGKLKLGVVGVGLVGLAALALVAYRKVPAPSVADQGPAVAQAPQPPAPPPPPQPVAAAPAVPTAVTPPALPVAATAAAMLAEAKQAAGAEDWDKSKAALDKIGATIEDPGVRKDATTLRRRVDVELQASVQFSQFDEASGAKNYADAVARYEQIPAESIYKRRAKPRYDEARTLLVAEHMAAADKARAAGKCAEVRSEVAEVMRLEPRNLLAKDLVRLCKPRQEAPAPPVVARPARPRPSPPLAVAEAPSRPERPEAPAPKPRAEPADVEAGDPDVLMKQAREAWLRQQCGAAVDLSRKALHAKPGMTDAYQIIAVCSCTLKDTDAAGRAYAKLDDKNRSLVRQLCQKNGITVGE
jgi:ABC transport system ATP-binding/permease protein